MRHLVTQGHQRIWYLATTEVPASRLRLTAYLAALREAAIEPEAGWVRPLTGGDGAGSIPFPRLSRDRMMSWMGGREAGSGKPVAPRS